MHATKWYHACPIFSEGTCARYIPHINKLSYSGQKCLLSLGHNFRMKKKYICGKESDDVAPIPLLGDEVLLKSNNSFFQRFRKS